MLTIEQSKAGNEVVLAIVGVVDEHADLTPLLNVIGTGAADSALVLDMAGIRRINSVGVREWIRAMQRMPTDVPLVWARVSTAMVAQLNMISNFSGHARIRSFFAPYYCEACDLEQRFLLTLEDDLAEGRPKAPPKSCGECGALLEFDDIEEDYLGGLLDLKS